MTTLKGRPLSPGYAAGAAYVHALGRGTTPRRQLAPAEVPAEQERFARTVARAALDLEAMRERVRAELGDAEAEIFSAHIALLHDPPFLERVKARIARDRVNVEQAVETIVGELAGALAQVDNEYIRERAQDIRDLGARVLRLLAREDSPLARLPPESVVVAHEFLPSDVLELDRAHVVAFVTEQGGETGHAAILARSLGIPAVSGIPDATRRIPHGARVLVDGERGEVEVEPADQALARFRRHKQRFDEARARAEEAGREECRTRDGAEIHLYGNIGRDDEAAQIERHFLRGVGLFRTEFLFLDRHEPPAFERHCEIYARVARALGGRPLVVRTLDFGGDKYPTFMAPRFESNPTLGLRGLRFSLAAARDLFLTQLKAIACVGARQDVRVLFPMVLGRADLAQAIAALREAAGALGVERLPRVGAMIETPSSVFTIDEIAQQADFLSIGTNDLTQFILAADRNALEVVEDYSALHPAVLRAMKQVVDAAGRRGRPVCVCGEVAADPVTACLLVGMGVRELSMNPVAAPRVRQALRAARLADLEALACEALACETPAEVRARLAEALPTKEQVIGDM